MLLLKDWLKIPRYSKHVSSIWISKEEKKGEGFKHVDSTSFQVNWRRTNPTNPTNLITLAIRHPPTSVVWLDTGSQIASSILIKPGTRCFVFGYVVKSSIARQKPTLIEFGRERGGVCGYTPEINRAPVVTFSRIPSSPPSLSQKKVPQFNIQYLCTSETEYVTHWFPGWVPGGFWGFQGSLLSWQKYPGPNQLRS